MQVIITKHKTVRLLRGAILALALTGFFAVNTATALPETCIQDPVRKSACPHLIYKMVTGLDDSEPDKSELVCVCLTDFKSLWEKADSEVAQKIQEMKVRSITAQLGISEEKLKEIVSYN